MREALAYDAVPLAKNPTSCRYYDRSVVGPAGNGSGMGNGIGRSAGCSRVSVLALVSCWIGCEKLICLPWLIV